MASLPKKQENDSTDCSKEVEKKKDAQSKLAAGARAASIVRFIQLTNSLTPVNKSFQIIEEEQAKMETLTDDIRRVDPLIVMELYKLMDTARSCIFESKSFLYACKPMAVYMQLATYYTK